MAALKLRNSPLFSASCFTSRANSAAFLPSTSQRRTNVGVDAVALLLFRLRPVPEDDGGLGPGPPTMGEPLSSPAPMAPAASAHEGPDSPEGPRPPPIDAARSPR